MADVRLELAKEENASATEQDIETDTTSAGMLYKGLEVEEAQ